MPNTSETKVSKENTTGYKKNWGKWIILYVIIAIVVYYIIYLIYRQTKPGYSGQTGNATRQNITDTLPY